MAEKEVKYSFWVALKKTFKNGIAVMVLPAAIYLVDNVTAWAPEEQKTWMVPLAGFLGYFIKNYLAVKFKIL